MYINPRCKKTPSPSPLIRVSRANSLQNHIMLTGADIRQLKEYVAAQDAGGQRQAESTVRLHVTHSNLKASFIEIRLDLYMTVEAVKAKLSSHCGTSPGDMLLTLRDTRGSTLAQLSDNSRLLGFYSPRDEYQLHIQDLNPHSLSAHGWLEDTTKVQKYVMSDADYDRRDNTYRKHKEQMRKLDPDWTAEKELCARRGLPYTAPKPKIESEDYLAEESSSIQVGCRCEIAPGAKRGEVRFVGKCEGLPRGYWIGVQYDEPVGKNDGSIKGKRYFSCPSGYGGFIRATAITIGDFPPLDEFAFSDSDEI